MKYLGIPLEKPKVAFFGFTGCEGCQLQIANKEETLTDLLGAVEVMNFRLISSDKDDGYDLAFIEGSITTDNEVLRLKKIREQAKTLVAIGACACFGGVNNLRDRFVQSEAVKEIYGSHSIDSDSVRKISEVVPVDYELPGCPISKTEFEWFNLNYGLKIDDSKYINCIDMLGNNIKVKVHK